MPLLNLVLYPPFLIINRHLTLEISLSVAPQIPRSAAQAPVSSQMAAQPQSPAVPAAQLNTGNFFLWLDLLCQLVRPLLLKPQMNQVHIVTTLGGFFSLPGSYTSMAQQTAPPLSTAAPVIVPQLSDDKFQPKSTVWTDTLSSGLVNLNISGAKKNPLSDIAVDFDAINQKENRMEKPALTAVTSTVTMGKSMESGFGIGCAGASVLRAPEDPMVGSSMGMGYGVWEWVVVLSKALAWEFRI